MRDLKKIDPTLATMTESIVVPSDSDIFDGMIIYISSGSKLKDPNIGRKIASHGGLVVKTNNERVRDLLTKIPLIVEYKSFPRSNTYFSKIPPRILIISYWSTWQYHIRFKLITLTCSPSL